MCATFRRPSLTRYHVVWERSLVATETLFDSQTTAERCILCEMQNVVWLKTLAGGHHRWFLPGSLFLMQLHIEYISFVCLLKFLCCLLNVIRCLFKPKLAFKEELLMWKYINSWTHCRCGRLPHMSGVSRFFAFLITKKLFLHSILQEYFDLVMWWMNRI
jgi:hypothetical protein